ncbi:MAG: hypothetical protein F6K26_30120 [Moorea sp. SIO2I5]|nr:hypothetical protein [Moorena sp. SIO2I5]
MVNKKKILEDTMTLLMSVTPDTSLGKLLNLCLAAKADPNISKSAREFAVELLEDPSKIAYWTMDVIGSDANYTDVEWEALNDMKLDNPETFVADFQSELESLDLD